MHAGEPETPAFDGIRIEPDTIIDDVEAHRRGLVGEGDDDPVSRCVATCVGQCFLGYPQEGAFDPDGQNLRPHKAIVLMTDGDNTQNRFGDGQTTMDQRTAAACASAKTAGIKIYSIRVINGNSSLLRGCASETSMFYEVSNASQLGPIFQQIAREISQIRLTM